MLNEPDLKGIGKRIRQAREDIGMNQRELGEKIGMSDSQLSAYENGKKSIGLTTLARIAVATNKTIDEIYFGSEATKPITKSNDVSELIVNCFDALFEKKIIKYADYLLRYNPTTCDYETTECIDVMKYDEEIFELLQNLKQFKNNEDSYLDAQQFKKQLLASAANKIKKQMEWE